MMIVPLPTWLLDVLLATNLSLSVAMMCLGSLVIALTPTYAQIGAAAVAIGSQEGLGAGELGKEVVIELLLDFEPGLTGAISERLEKYIIADDVQVLDVAPLQGLLLRDDPALRFEILIDVAGVDYLDYGRSEWRTRRKASGSKPPTAPISN